MPRKRLPIKPTRRDNDLATQIADIEATQALKLPEDGRRRPPARRRSETVKTKFSGDAGFDFTIYLTISYFDNGDPMDVFLADAGKEGTAMQHLTTDACVLISLALQSGRTVEELQHSVSTVPMMRPDLTEGERPGSVVGVVLNALREGRDMVKAELAAAAP